MLKKYTQYTVSQKIRATFIFFNSSLQHSSILTIVAYNIKNKLDANDYSFAHPILIL